MEHVADIFRVGELGAILRDARVLAKALGVAYAAGGEGHPHPTLLIDLETLLDTDAASVSRLKYLYRHIVPGEFLEMGGMLVLSGDPAIATAQWASKPLRESIRLTRELNPDKLGAAAYIDLLKGRIEGHCPSVLGLMPVADGARAPRRSAKTAPAETQLSLFDFLDAAPISEDDRERGIGEAVLAADPLPAEDEIEDTADEVEVPVIAGRPVAPRPQAAVEDAVAVDTETGTDKVPTVNSARNEGPKESEASAASAMEDADAERPPFHELSYAYLPAWRSSNPRKPRARLSAR